MLKDYENGDPFRAIPSMKSRRSSNNYKITKKIWKENKKKFTFEDI